MGLSRLFGLFGLFGLFRPYAISEGFGFRAPSSPPSDGLSAASADRAPGPDPGRSKRLRQAAPRNAVNL